VCVADGGNNRIQVFTSTGAFIGQFGSLGANAGQLNDPARLAFNGDRTTLYVADINNHRVQAFEYTTPPPMILALERAGAAITLKWSSLPGRTYQLESKTNLSQTNWSTSGGTIATTNYPAAVDVDASEAQRFFHVVLLP